MEEKKSIYECYQEIKQREISELKEAIKEAGGDVLFDLDDAPTILVNFDGYFPHPADVRVSQVRLKDEKLLIDGQEKDESGCAEWYEDDSPIYIEDIAYGHVSFITAEIKSGNYLPSFDATTGNLSDGSWCAIDGEEKSWEYQSDCNDDDTYISGNFITDDDDDKLVVDFDGSTELPKGVKAALLASGYKLGM